MVLVLIMSIVLLVSAMSVVGGRHWHRVACTNCRACGASIVVVAASGIIVVADATVMARARIVAAIIVVVATVVTVIDVTSVIPVTTVFATKEVHLG